MSVGQSYRELAVAQKGRARGAPAYSVYVNRPFGRLLASAAHALGWTPNQVSIVSAAFTFAGIGIIAAGPRSFVTGLVIWILLAVGYAWDSADGQVARLRGGGSLAGEWLDHIFDSAKLVSLHLAVAIGAFRTFVLEDKTWLLVPLGFAVVATVGFFGMILNDLLRARSGAPQAAESGGSSRWGSLLRLPVDYGVVCAVFVLWGWQEGFQVAYALLALAATLHLAAALPAWFRRMKALG